MPTKEAVLTELLVSLCEVDELKRFVRFGPKVDDLSSLLTHDLTPQHFATEFIDLHRRRGLVDVSFFDRLVDLKPKRANEIRAVQKLWISEAGSIAPLTHHLTTQGEQTGSMSEGPKEPIQVFVSYSHRDQSFVEELGSHLKLLQRQGVIRLWHDCEITAGEEWRDAIESRLASADIVLLLVSSNFLSSEFCWSVELSRAMDRHERGDATVIPIFVRSCLWQDAPFAKLQGVPKNAMPIGSSRDTDRAWTEVATVIRQTSLRISESRDRGGG